MFDAFSDTRQDSQDLTVRRFNLTSSSEFHSAILPTQSVRLVIHPAALPVFPRRKCQSPCTHHVTLGDRVNEPAEFEVL